MELASGNIHKRIKLEEIPTKTLFPITEIKKFSNGRYDDCYEVECCGNWQVFLPSR